jgi:hypothetical protein
MIDLLLLSGSHGIWDRQSTGIDSDSRQQRRQAGEMEMDDRENELPRSSERQMFAREGPFN